MPFFVYTNQLYPQAVYFQNIFPVLPDNYIDLPMTD